MESTNGSKDADCIRQEGIPEKGKLFLSHAANDGTQSRWHRAGRSNAERHLATPDSNFNTTGFRVALRDFSAYQKNLRIAQPADYIAILKLIETRFNVPSLR